jgi:hypothetical protein
MNDDAKADYIDFDSNVEALAEAKGCTVFYPAANQLTIDIDNDDQYQDFLVRVGELCAGPLRST